MQQAKGQAPVEPVRKRRQMAQRSGSDQRRLGRAVTIRVDDSMNQAIVQAAGDKTRGDWLRGLIAKELTIENQAAKRRAPGVIKTLNASRADLAALRIMAISAGRSIGILKLTAMQMRQSNLPDLHKQAESTLTEMRATAHEIQTLLRDLESEP